MGYELETDEDAEVLHGEDGDEAVGSRVGHAFAEGCDDRPEAHEEKEREAAEGIEGGETRGLGQG